MVRSRLRRDIEYQNSAVGTNVIDLEVKIKTTLERRAKPAAPVNGTVITSSGVVLGATRTTSQTHIPKSMISDTSGRDFWRKHFGDVQI